MSSDDEMIVDEVQIEDQLEEVADNVEVVEEVEADDQGEDGDSKRVVKPKRAVRNPQPKLNETTLRGAKGLEAVKGYFERVKFKGRGYEEQDLNVLMKTYEYWCHRLFPKFPFDACVAKLETLGTKRSTISQLNRIRMDLDVVDDKPLTVDEDQIETDGFVDATIENQGISTVQGTQEPNRLFDQLLPSTSTTSHITEEQLERIRQNKERAESLRREKLSKINLKAAHHLEVSRSLSTDDYEKQPSENGKSEEKASQNNKFSDNQNGELDELPSDIDEEDNIDNILDAINSGDSLEEQVKAQEMVTGTCISGTNSDSDDESSIEPKSRANISKNASILDSDE